MSVSGHPFTPGVRSRAGFVLAKGMAKPFNQGTHPERKCNEFAQAEPTWNTPQPVRFPLVPKFLTYGIVLTHFRVS